MQQIITAKLKLNCTTEQKKLLRNASLAYRDALNHTSQLAYDLNKCSNTRKLQQAIYYELRERYKLPSQMACNVPRQVAATYKGLWTKVRQNQEALKLGRTKKRYKGLDQAPKYISRTMTLNFGRDFSFFKNQISLITLSGRIKVSYSGYSRHLELIRSGETTIGAARLWYDKRKKEYYLLVSLELSKDAPDPERLTRITAVDVGLRYHAVVTDTHHQSQFYSGRKDNHKADRYHRLRKRLQRKGTRSATRLLVAIAERERRFKANCNHCLSKQIAQPQTLIGLESLIHIRERTDNFKRGKKASSKQRKVNRRRASWSFAQLQSMIDYKAVLVGSLAIEIDARYTSQQCIRCGHTSRDNRPNKGLLFSCKVCGYTCHADLLGSRNILLRTLLTRQDWVSTGQLSTVPNVSDAEAKARNLSRFLELRWSLDTNHHFNNVSDGS